MFIVPAHLSPLSSSSSFPLSCCVESKEKGLKIQQYPQERSLNSHALTFKAQGDTWLTAQFGLLLIDIYLFLFVVIWYIIFCLYKTGPRKKQHNTSPQFYFYFLNFLTKTWGEETTLLHKCLSQNSTSIFVKRTWNLDDEQLIAPPASCGWQVFIFSLLEGSRISEWASTDAGESSMYQNPEFWIHLKSILQLLIFLVSPWHSQDFKDDTYKMIKHFIDPKLITCQHLFKISKKDWNLVFIMSLKSNWKYSSIYIFITNINLVHENKRNSFWHVSSLSSLGFCELIWILALSTSKKRVFFSLKISAYMFICF